MNYFIETRAIPISIVIYIDSEYKFQNNPL